MPSSAHSVMRARRPVSFRFDSIDQHVAVRHFHQPQTRTSSAEKSRHGAVRYDYKS
jgi:hypothetical protein